MKQVKTYLFPIIKNYTAGVFKYRRAAILILVTGNIETVITILTPLLYRNFFNLLTSGQPTDLVAEGLLEILVVIAGAHGLRWLLIRISVFFSVYMRTVVMRDLSNRCFAYLHRHSFDYFSSEFVGSLVKRVQWYVKAFEAVYEKFVWDLMPLFVGISLIVGVLFYVNPILSGVLIIWIIIFLIFNAIVTKYKIKYDLMRSQAETKTTAVLADTITNHSNVKLFNGYDREVKNFFNVTESLRKLRRFTSNISIWIDSVQSFLMFGLEIGIFYFAIKLWQQGLITIGDFFLIQAYVITIFWRIWDFGRVIRDIYENLADASEMYQILITPHGVKDVNKAKALKVPQGVIEFRDVFFKYPKGADVMKKLNLTISAGERLALIGPSGAGKTTAVKLLLRMYDVSGGQILIDGQNIAKVTQESLWQNISLVPQDPILFHKPLIDNIRYGRPEATDEEVIKAAKAAHCHEFIMELPDGYDTYVGERGIKLSGGERQRVAIARAILRNAPILLLDEATSSLDSESESFIQDALNELMKGKTVIVIAHRLSTVKKMDRIVVIDEGQVIEEGTHKNLNHLADGTYRKLWELQAGGFS